MLKRYLASFGISALVGAATIAAPINTASAFTLSAPSWEPVVTAEHAIIGTAAGGTAAGAGEPAQ